MTTTQELTTEEVERRCGLMPADQFLAAHPEGEDRRSGRTTRMLVQAVVDASQGKTVAIMSHHTRRHAKTVHDRFREMCEMCDVDPGRTVFDNNPGSEHLRGFDHLVPHWDHV